VDGIVTAWSEDQRVATSLESDLNTLGDEKWELVEITASSDEKAATDHIAPVFARAPGRASV